MSYVTSLTAAVTYKWCKNSPAVPFSLRAAHLAYSTHISHSECCIPIWVQLHGDPRHCAHGMFVECANYVLYVADFTQWLNNSLSYSHLTTRGKRYQILMWTTQKKIPKFKLAKKMGSQDNKIYINRKFFPAHLEYILETRQQFKKILLRQKFTLHQLLFNVFLLYTLLFIYSLIKNTKSKYSHLDNSEDQSISKDPIRCLCFNEN